MKQIQTEKVPLRDLNLTSRFLFDKVMERTKAHEDVLSIILGKEIVLFGKAESEKEFRVSPLIRSIRVDIFSMDDSQTIYTTEMQSQRKPDLVKRSRYYQSMVDSGLLESGVASYNLLNDAYIILITTFDLFGYEKYRYTFRPRCEEVPELVLPDGATRIFLNTKGKNKEDVSEELVEFLKYAEETTDETAASLKSERIRRIHEHVRKVKNSEKIGVKYMQRWEEIVYEREEGRQEGRQEGRLEGRQEGRLEGREEATKETQELILKLIQDGRLDLIEKMAKDSELLNVLFKEYSI